MSASEARREFAVEVARRLKEAGFEALWAGGCVRDFLLGKIPKDYDVATNARPEQVRELFGKRHTVPVGASFGVIMVLGPTKEAGQIEVATFRTEGPYLDGRRPEHVVYCTPEEDARRRDFTINGMFYDPQSQQTLDYVGGRHDLAAGIVRAIGHPRDRMTEDKLRMLRAVRFAATLEFDLEPETAAAVREMSGEIRVVSVERIAQELRRMLVDGHRRHAMEWLVAVDLMREILPELTFAKEGDAAWNRTLQMLHLLQAPTFELAFATLALEATCAEHVLDSATARPSESAVSNASREFRADRSHRGDAIWALCRRLKLSNDGSETICFLVSQRRRLRDLRTMTLAERKRLLAHAHAGELLELFRVETLARGDDLSAFSDCQEFLRTTPREALNPPPLIDGADLKSLGVPTGPKFRELLDAVREEQLNERLATSEDALEWLRLRIAKAT